VAFPKAGNTEDGVIGRTGKRGKSTGYPSKKPRTVVAGGSTPKKQERTWGGEGAGESVWFGCARKKPLGGKRGGNQQKKKGKREIATARADSYLQKGRRRENASHGRGEREKKRITCTEGVRLRTG